MGEGAQYHHGCAELLHLAVVVEVGHARRAALGIGVDAEDFAVRSQIEVARFARTLGTLVGSAVPLIAGVRIVQGIVRNQILAEAVAKIADGAKRGEGVSKPMREAGVFPGLAVHLVGVGEETGRLDSMLLQLADIYDKDVRTSVKALTSVFEPAIILVMGIIIGTVVLSMLTAIFSINDIAF